MRTWSVIENDAVVAPTPSAVTTISADILNDRSCDRFF